MAMGFEQRIAGFIRENELIESRGRLLLAVSGGADSTALLYAICALKDRAELDAELVCAHINHQLRAARGDRDQEFVVEQAEKLGLDVSTRRVDVRGFARKAGLSIETAARELRIESLLDIADNAGCDHIATAHQKNDNAETLIQRLARGTGIRGLGGIWPMRAFGRRNVRFVRPMLCVTRMEVIEYLNERNLKWRQDNTNADCKFRRNYIRHRLLPAIQADCAPPLLEQLFDLSKSARGYYNLVCSRADEAWPGSTDLDGQRVMLDCGRLLAEPRAVRVELVRRALAALGSGEREITQEHYERILQLAEQNTGRRKVELPNAFTAQREYGRLVFDRAETDRESAATESVEVQVPGRTAFGAYVIETRILQAQDHGADSCFQRNDSGAETYVERFDWDNVKPPLVVRSRRDGDRFIPLGSAAAKKVGKFLSDARVPADARRKVLVLEDREKVIWLWPIRMSEQAKVTQRTRKILQIDITNTPNPDQGKETER